MPIETEIKFRVDDLAGLAERLEAAGFTLQTPRAFESNVLYDTPDRAMRARTEILRIRSYAGRWTVTHKRLPDVGPGEDTPQAPHRDRDRGRRRRGAGGDLPLARPGRRLPLRKMARRVDRRRRPLRGR